MVMIETPNSPELDVQRRRSLGPTRAANLCNRTVLFKLTQALFGV